MGHVTEELRGAAGREGPFPVNATRNKWERRRGEAHSIERAGRLSKATWMPPPGTLRAADQARVAWRRRAREDEHKTREKKKFCAWIEGRTGESGKRQSL